MSLRRKCFETFWPEGKGGVMFKDPLKLLNLQKYLS